MEIGRSVHDSEYSVLGPAVLEWQEKGGGRSSSKDLFAGGKASVGLVTRDSTGKAINVECDRLHVSYPASFLESAAHLSTSNSKHS